MMSHIRWADSKTNESRQKVLKSQKQHDHDSQSNFKNQNTLMVGVDITEEGHNKRTFGVLLGQEHEHGAPISSGNWLDTRGWGKYYLEPLEGFCFFQEWKHNCVWNKKNSQTQYKSQIQMSPSYGSFLTNADKMHFRLPGSDDHKNRWLKRAIWIFRDEGFITHHQVVNSQNYFPNENIFVKIMNTLKPLPR